MDAWIPVSFVQGLAFENSFSTFEILSSGASGDRGLFPGPILITSSSGPMSRARRRPMGTVFQFGKNFPRKFRRIFRRNFRETGNFAEIFAENFAKKFGENFGKKFGKKFGENFGEKFGENFGEYFAKNFG